MPFVFTDDCEPNVGKFFTVRPGLLKHKDLEACLSVSKEDDGVIAKLSNDCSGGKGTVKIFDYPLKGNFNLIKF